MAEIVLRDVQKDGNYYHLEAVLEQGKLTIQGHDIGKTVEEFWGEDEYEYWYEFDQENTEHLFKAILADTASDISDMSEDELLKSFQIKKHLRSRWRECSIRPTFVKSSDSWILSGSM